MQSHLRRWSFDDELTARFILLLGAEIFGAAKRAEMANVEHVKKIIPLNTSELWFRCLRFGVWGQCKGFGFVGPN